MKRFFRAPSKYHLMTVFAIALARISLGDSAKPYEMSPTTVSPNALESMRNGDVLHGETSGDYFFARKDEHDNWHYYGTKNKDQIPPAASKPVYGRASGSGAAASPRPTGTPRPTATPGGRPHVTVPGQQYHLTQ